MDVIPEILSGFTNRDYSIFFWSCIFVIFAIKRQEIRSLIYQLLKSFLHRNIVFFTILMTIYVVIQILLLDIVNLWDVSLTKDLIIWFFGFGFASMIKAAGAGRDKNFIWNILKSTVSLTILVEFIINLYIFPLVVEIILIPVLFLLFGALAHLELYERYKDGKKLLNIILSIIGLMIIFYVSKRIIENPSTFFTCENLWNILFTFIMSITFLPYIYFFSLFVIYEDLIVVIGGILRNHNLNEYFTKKLLLKFKFNLFKLVNFNINYRFRFLNVTTKYEIDNIFDDT